MSHVAVVGASLKQSASCLCRGRHEQRLCRFEGLARYEAQRLVSRCSSHRLGTWCRGASPRKHLIPHVDVNSNCFRSYRQFASSNFFHAFVGDEATSDYFRKLAVRVKGKLIPIRYGFHKSASLREVTTEVNIYVIGWCATVIFYFHYTNHFIVEGRYIALASAHIRAVFLAVRFLTLLKTPPSHDDSDAGEDRSQKASDCADRWNKVVLAKYHSKEEASGGQRYHSEGYFPCGQAPQPSKHLIELHCPAPRAAIIKTGQIMKGTARILQVFPVQLLHCSVSLRQEPRNGEGPNPLGAWAFVVPYGRIELPTSALPRMRSTTELIRRGSHKRSEACGYSQTFLKDKEKNRAACIYPPLFLSVPA